MYAIMGAAQNCANDYAEMLKSIGFKQVDASPCVFYRDTRKIRTFVHDDDYVSTALPTHFKWYREQFEKRYQIKTQWFGPGNGYQREVKILNRIVGCDNATEVVFEADPPPY